MKRTKHNLSNYKLATMDMGQLVPVQVQEVLPGDTMRIQTSAMIRVSPMVAPVMHPVTIRFHHFYVPNRIIWDGWEDFITGGANNDNAETPPQFTLPDATPSGILDYMGVPPVTNLTVNALPLMAFNKIWNEYYRDQDLQEERELWDNSIPRVSWRKDYFTAARPSPQKGDDVVLPIGAGAPIKASEALANSAQISNENDVDADIIAVNASNEKQADLYVDLSEATGISVNEFREYFALQRYAEARSQYGSRYTEYLRYLGVKSSDARLQRPEYLGGGKSNLQFSEVLQTAADDIGAEQTPVGTLRGHGIGALRTKNTKRYFEEHGHVITMMSVVPKSIYQDGVARNWLRMDKEDYFQKELQHIGQQKILQGEVYALEPETINEIFGYGERYSEYRNTPSTVSGEFRDLLDYWHLGRKFETAPALNEEFITCEPSKRIHAEQTQHSLWCMINNKVVSRRMVGNVSIGRIM